MFTFLFIISFIIAIIVVAVTKKDASKSGGEHINSVSKAEAKNIVGGYSSFSPKFSDIYLYAGINHIEDMIKSNMLKAPRCVLSAEKEGLYIETVVMGENVYFGIKKNEVSEVHYVGGTQAEKDTGKAVAGALVLGVVGLLAGMINQDRILLAIEKNDGQVILLGIENQFKPNADKFFSNCFSEKFNPIIQIDNNTEEKINTSNADELIKFKQLLDNGAITQDEYDAKKKELLNL